MGWLLVRSSLEIAIVDEALFVSCSGCLGHWGDQKEKKGSIFAKQIDNSDNSEAASQFMSTGRSKISLFCEFFIQTCWQSVPESTWKLRISALCIFNYSISWDCFHHLHIMGMDSWGTVIIVSFATWPLLRVDRFVCCSLLTFHPATTSIARRGSFVVHTTWVNEPELPTLHVQICTMHEKSANISCQSAPKTLPVTNRTNDVYSGL